MFIKATPERPHGIAELKRAISAGKNAKWIWRWTTNPPANHDARFRGWNSAHTKRQALSDIGHAIRMAERRNKLDQEARERIKNGLGRYDVIRNSDQAGNFWSVIDKSKRTMVEGRYVSDHRSNRAAWRIADKLNIQHEEGQSG